VDNSGIKYILALPRPLFLNLE